MAINFKLGREIVKEYGNQKSRAKREQSHYCRACVLHSLHRKAFRQGSFYSTFTRVLLRVLARLAWGDGSQ